MKIKVLSRHPSHSAFRNGLPEIGVRALIRLGSTTPTSIVFPKSTALGRKIVEINTVEAVKNSASKLLMKQKFTEVGVRTANWFLLSQDLAFQQIQNEGEGAPIDGIGLNFSELPYPIVAKHIFGSRGTGNYKLDSEAALRSWTQGKNLNNYIFEKFHNYSREYRLHCTEDGCFYTCRKVLKEGAQVRWYRNDSNSSWLLETNPGFDRPVNWDNIVSECVKALKVVGLDVAAFDVRVQSSKDKTGAPRENPEFIVIESNSAASHGTVTTQKYLETIPLLIQKKANGNS